MTNKIIITSLFLLLSCSFFLVPKKIKQDLSICYSGNYTGLDTLINIGGYYSTDVQERQNDSTFVTRDAKLGSTLVFFTDGKVAYRRSHTDYLIEDIKSKDISRKELSDYFEWGNYVIKKDTIVIEYLRVPTIHSPWAGYELKFTIKNHNALILETIRSFDNNPYVKYSRNEKNHFEHSDFVLIEHEVLPKPIFPNNAKNALLCE